MDEEPRQFRIEMFTWDANEAFPDGTHVHHQASEAVMKITTDIAKFVLDGGTIMTTLPLAEPGRALVIGYKDESGLRR